MHRWFLLISSVCELATCVCAGKLPGCFAYLEVARADANGASCELYPTGSVPGERPDTFGPEVHTLREDGIDEYNNVTIPTLTFFLVPGNDAVLVIAPGGGYQHLDYNGEGIDIAVWANSIGMSAVVLKYRVPGRPWLHFGDVAFMDAQRAVRLVRYRARELGLSRSKIGFIGFSAGGHLTGRISTKFASQAYSQIDAADAVSARPDLALLVYPWMLVDHDNKVTMDVSSRTPPSFVAAAEDDPTAPIESSLFYYHALKQNKVDMSELHIFPKGGHGYGNCVHPQPKEANLAVCSWPDLAQKFLQTHFAGNHVSESRESVVI